MCHLELSSAITSVVTPRTIPVCFHPCHMITNTVLPLADTFLDSPLIGQRTSQLLTEPETGWERWSKVLGAGLSLLASDWSVAASSVSWLASTELVYWGRGWTLPGLRLRWWGEASTQQRSGCCGCRVNSIPTHCHKPTANDIISGHTYHHSLSRNVYIVLPTFLVRISTGKSRIVSAKFQNYKLWNLARKPNWIKSPNWNNLSHQKLIKSLETLNSESLYPPSMHPAVEQRQSKAEYSFLRGAQRSLCSLYIQWLATATAHNIDR